MTPPQTHLGAWENGPTVLLETYKGPTLEEVVKMFDGYGYDCYLLNSRAYLDPPVLVPVSGSFFIHPDPFRLKGQPRRTSSSELCAYDPFIFLDAEEIVRNTVTVMKTKNCWTDVFVARRGASKDALLETFGLPMETQFSQCPCI